MPEFESSNWIGVEVDEFLEACNSSEIDEVVEWLESSGHVVAKKVSSQRRSAAIPDLEWDAAISALSGMRYQLSPEEEAMVKSIAKKYK